MFAGLVAVNVLQDNTGRVGVTHVPGAIIVGWARIRTRGTKKRAQFVIAEKHLKLLGLSLMQHAVVVRTENSLFSSRI